MTVINPADMGTTGLVAWCVEAVASAKARHRRFRAACSILRKRGASLERFKLACYAGCNHKWRHAYLRYKV